jgi:hypothetical protein
MRTAITIGPIRYAVSRGIAYPRGWLIGLDWTEGSSHSGCFPLLFGEN